MEKTIDEYIREDKGLRQILLKQDGGIMKYWAEHPDADGIEALYNDYREQCIHDFREANKWSMSENEIKGAALAEDHIRKELACQAALKPELAKFQEIAEQANQIVDGYTDHAFRELYRRRNPSGVQPKALYNEVIGAYNSPFGVAFQCLSLVLDEHRGVRRKDDSGERLWVEFKARKYAPIYMAGFKKLRQAVDEMIVKSTQNKSEEESRQICRQLAAETMKRLKRFTRMVNGDYDLVKIPNKSGGFVTWSTKDLEQLGYDVSRGFKKEYIVVSKEEMSWLRGGMMYRTPEDSGSMTPLQECFQRYYIVLEDIGRIWAAQLLVRGIDMRELERETGCVMSFLPDEFYYVNRDHDDHHGDCCVYDEWEAKELLHQIRVKAPHVAKQITWEDKKQCFKTAVLNVMERKKSDGNYLLERDSQWIAIYRFAVDIAIMYEKNKQSAPEGNSPQYKTFSDFAHEHQLDVNPPTRLPFEKEYISRISKDSYQRYNSTYPWPQDGLTDARSYVLYTQLEDVYMALKEEYENLVHQKEQETN